MKKRYILIGVLALALLLTAGFVYHNYREKKAQEQWIAHMTDTVERDTFYEGIYLDDVHLGGLTLQEAYDQFKIAAEERLNNLRAELTYEDQSWVFTHEDINAEINWEEKLEELYELGREGDLEERYKQIEEIRENKVQAETTLTMDITRIRGAVEEIADSLSVEPVNADLSFHPGEEQMFRITPEQEGRKVDSDELYRSVEEIFKSGQPGIVAIEPAVVEPEVRAADLERATSKIVTFSTSMSGSSENRMSNIALALRKINGTKLNPGEVFSFNQVVGNRTAKAGFKPAPVIMPDKSMQDGIGGGICQASSTLFNAAALAGLEIVERYHHSFPVAYLDPGLDATVAWGGADLKFRNNRNTPVFIRAYRSGTKACVEIYGEPLPNNGKYQLTTKVIETMKAPAPKRIEDKNGKYVKKPGGEYVHVKSRTGLKVNTYRVLVQNGKIVSSELLVTNFYRPIQGIIYYREAKPEPDPTPTPSAAPKDEEKPKDEKPKKDEQKEELKKEEAPESPEPKDTKQNNTESGKKDNGPKSTSEEPDSNDGEKSEN